MRRKRFVIIGLLAAVLLVGSLAGLALAQTVDTGQPQTLLARVAAILGIDQQKVEDAYAQAQREMRDEAVDSYLKNLVDQGKITQGQADQYSGWWQARPEALLPGAMGRNFGFHGFRGGMRGGRGFCWGLPPIPAPTPQASGTSF
ncbi:MAG: hypothetical protein KJ624_05735 [Chloroflexi bacterium]|nr:hypothetical protein [Chloroflexota bacterium]